MSVLVRQYADLRLGDTDASVVAICERLGIVTVATVNLRDFATVRPRRWRRHLSHSPGQHRCPAAYTSVSFPGPILLTKRNHFLAICESRPRRTGGALLTPSLDSASATVG